MIFVKIICSVLLVTQVFADYDRIDSLPPTCKEYCESDECPCVGCYKPVCAKNGEDIQLFASECSLKLVNSEITDDCNENKKNNHWHKVADKVCEEDEEDFCPDFCYDIYEPICAYNGTSYVTYGNGCELLRANCCSSDWAVYSYGECPACLTDIIIT